MRLPITALTALLLGPLAVSRGAELPAGAPVKPLLLAAYYCWYHAPTNAVEPWLHWTYPASQSNALALAAQRPGEPPLNSAARPLAGFYDSSAPEVAEWHVKLAQAAGIDAFLVDWWGEHRGLDEAVDRGIVAAVQKLGFKYALLDERAQFHRNFADYQAMLVRALKRHKDNPAYLRLDGKPVVYLYQVAQKPGLTADQFPLLKEHVEREVGAVYWIVDKIAHDAKAAGTDREKRIPADWLATPGVDAFGLYSTFSNFRAHTYDQLIGKYRHLTKLAHEVGKKMLLPVHPGHDNSFFRDDPYVMPRRDGDTLRDYLRAATDAGADFILVTSWNEWPETTVVEPSSHWTDPYRYLKILAEWRGGTFAPVPPPRSPATDPVRIVIVGDSTVCDYPADRPERGWGQFIEEWFVTGAVKVINLAASGRSTKTFIAEGRWRKALAEKPDVVLIQFGHNDSHAPERPESTDAATTYREFLRRYIDEARAAGGVPVLVTPMVRRTFGAGGKLTDILQPYADAMKAVAAEKRIALIDLHAMSKRLVEDLGPTRAAEMANKPGDGTHFNEKGARAMADLLLRELPTVAPQLKPRLRENADAPATPGVTTAGFGAKRGQHGSA